MSNEEENLDDLPNDFCQQAEEDEEYEENLAIAIEKMIDEGRPQEGLVLGEYFFTIRSIAKLELNGLTPADVCEVLIQQRFDRSAFSGSQTVHSKCNKGHVVVVFEPTILEGERAKAPFKVVTGFVP